MDEIETNPSFPLHGNEVSPTETAPIVKEKRPNSWPVIGLLILLVVSLGIAGYFFYQNTHLKQQVSQTQPTLSPKATKTPEIPSLIPTIDPTVNWEIYENKDYKFSFKHPGNFKLSNLIEKPFYNLEESITFGIVLTQDIYTKLAQTPVIKVQVLETNKTIGQILDELKAGIEKTKEGMTDPENLYYNSNPPKIYSTESVRVGGLEATKVERFGGPSAPNAEILEYYVKSPSYIYILSANYGTNNPDAGQDGTLEKETLSKIIATFKFLQ
jgi:hypothetical protein